MADATGDWSQVAGRRRDECGLHWTSANMTQRGFDRNVIKPGTLMNMIDYIHLNPVRRGLVEKPEQWKWSSAAWYLGAGEVPIRVDPIPAEWLDDSS